MSRACFDDAVIATVMLTQVTFDRVQDLGLIIDGDYDGSCQETTSNNDRVEQM